MTCVWFNLQRKAFEEDRATWLKHQFLNLSPFPDSKKPPMSKSKSAFLICECLFFIFYNLLFLFTNILILESIKVNCWIIYKLKDYDIYEL